MVLAITLRGTVKQLSFGVLGDFFLDGCARFSRT